jgi:hypothetical protein
LRAQCLIDLAQGHEQGRLLLADQGKGDKHRVEGHIGAAQVEQPGNVIEGSDEMPVGAALLEGCAQRRKLLDPALGGLGRQMLIDRLIGQ